MGEGAEGCRWEGGWQDEMGPDPRESSVQFRESGLLSNNSAMDIREEKILEERKDMITAMQKGEKSRKGHQNQNAYFSLKKLELF
jgi:hypothetical protein